MCFVKTTLAAAAIVLVVTAVVHTVVGEAVWIRHLPRFEAPPLPFGSELAKRTIRVTWHLASVLALGFAALAWELARRPPDPFVTTTLAVTFAVSALLVLAFTRGKHPGWIAIGAAAILCAACGTSESKDAGADAMRTGAQPTCCNSCLNDVLRPAICTNGAWSCPSGSVTEADCVGQCTSSPFCMYLPKPYCASCIDGTTHPMVCNADAAKLECPAGTYYTFGDAGCGDASTD